MQEQSLNEERRLRLQRLAAVLRQFKMVDNCGIGDLLQGWALPSQAEIAKLIKSSQLKLPTSVTAEFVSDCVLAKLREPSPETLAWRRKYSSSTPELTNISRGRSTAGKYHKHVFKILISIFDGILSNPVIEQEVNDRRGRIDICFDNTSTEGFFSDMKVNGKAKLVVPFECKNYANDLANPEFDQLSGRLDPERGSLGFLVCRQTFDRAKTMLQCRDRLRKGESIIVLTDGCVEEMYTFRHDGRPDLVDRFVFERFRELWM